MNAAQMFRACFGPLTGTFKREKIQIYSIRQTSLDVTASAMCKQSRDDTQTKTFVIWTSLEMRVFVMWVSVQGDCVVLRSLTREARAPIVLILPLITGKCFPLVPWRHTPSSQMTALGVLSVLCEASSLKSQTPAGPQRLTANSSTNY